MDFLRAMEKRSCRRKLGTTHIHGTIFLSYKVNTCVQTKACDHHTFSDEVKHQGESHGGCGESDASVRSSFHSQYEK